MKTMKNKDTSYYLSKILRHQPQLENLKYDEYGWFNVYELLYKIGMSKEKLDDIVANNNKKRFRYNEDETKIKANQGHSFKIKDDFKRPKNLPHFLYHGTSVKNIKSIKRDGLIPMKRLHVHLSPDYDTATNVGSRKINHSADLWILKISARDLNKVHPIYISENGVYLVKEVPLKFFI